MDKSERLFYPWKLMEKIAFRPAREDIVGWLHCYGKFIHHFWQIPGYPPCEIDPDRQKGKVDGKVHFGPFQLEYGFKLEFSLEKYGIYIKIEQLCYQFDYDVNYFNEYDRCEKNWAASRQSEKKLEKVLNNLAGEDIERILEGKVVHPALHQHIKYKEIPHWIRIGTAAGNPFLFLYQLAFQLCDCYHDFKSSAAKREEFERLKNLFFDHFKNSSPGRGYFPISPGKLFNL